MRAYQLFKADRIVAESNFGGAMVEGTIRAVAPDVPVLMVHASRGKAVRAEPVVALYEQGRIHHVGQHRELEDQMCQWEPGSGSSPDWVDAMVWEVTELLGAAIPTPTQFITISKLRDDRCRRGNRLHALASKWPYV